MTTGHEHDSPADIAAAAKQLAHEVRGNETRPAADDTVQPCSSTRCTSRSRPCGVKRAFLCLFIRVTSRSGLRPWQAAA